MTKRVTKLLPVWIAVSAVILIAGIVLCALLGFNYAPELPKEKTFEVEYDVVVEIEDKRSDLKKICEDEFAARNLTVAEFHDIDEINPSTGSKTGNGKYVFSFDGSANDDALNTAKENVISAIKTQMPATAQISVSVHTATGESFAEPEWRAAVGIATAIVAVLIYVAIRFGVGSALTGLTVCVHDVVATLALFAIARIPVAYFAPMVIGGVAAFLSLLLWLVQCIKMRENFKEISFASYSAEEAVYESNKTAKKAVLGIAGAFAIAAVLLGVGLAVAGAPLGGWLLPVALVIPAGVSAYSSLVFGPALHVPVKACFDRFKSKKKRYIGKEKTEKAKEN